LLTFQANSFGLSLPGRKPAVGEIRSSDSKYCMQIKSEQGIASGIRRIEAVAGPAALEFLYERESVVRDLSNQLKVACSELPARVTGVPPLYSTLS